MLLIKTWRESSKIDVVIDVVHVAIQKKKQRVVIVSGLVMLRLEDELGHLDVVYTAES